MKHPGEILQEKISSSCMSRKELALRTCVTEKHICTVINGYRSISTSFARKLGYVFENTEYWLNLQAEYDSYQLLLQEENNVTEEEISILKNLKDIISYLIKSEYIHNSCSDVSKVIQLRNFLKISNLTHIPKITYNAAYRIQLTNNIRIDPYVLFAWQRLCEIETENIIIDKSININLLKNNVDNIKNLMFKNISEGIRDIQDIFKECGIKFKIVKNFRGAPVQGFIKETADRQLILCLTIRGKRADCFWFTLFHEIAHILNGDYKSRFVDFDSVHSIAEEMADQYSSDTLIAPDLYHEFILSCECTSWNNIIHFAESVGVQPFIVLGRLQNDGYLDWSDYSDKIVRYEWV